MSILQEYADFVDSRFKPGTFEEMVLHAVVGMVGEVSELVAKDADVGKEAGDFLFYTQKLCNLYGVDLISIYLTQKKGGDGRVSFIKQGGGLLERAKKQWVYGKKMQWEELEPFVYELCRGVREHVDVHYRCVRQTCCPSIITLMEDNKEKLTARFPNGYTDADAIARADVKGQ